MDQRKVMPMAMAANSGQTEGSGEDSRRSGSASVSVLTSTSLRSTRMPAMAGSTSGFSHIGEGPVITGMRVKFCGGGGDEVAHSSDSASHGLSPASAPCLALRSIFQSNNTKLNAKTVAPIVESRLRPPHGMSAE